jgi:AcrR family transcriptional regulator
MPADHTISSTDSPRLRRPRGEPRRLLVESGRKVFNERGYSEATTREIAERAEVSETLLYRYFGNKAGLFKASMVDPFVDVVERLIETWPPDDDSAFVEDSRRFIGALYDVFRKHRALAALLFAADVHTDSDLAVSGVLEEVRNEVERLVALHERLMARRGGSSDKHGLEVRSSVATIAGMATLGTWFFGRRRPGRDAIVDELAAALLRGQTPRSTAGRSKRSK